MCGRVGEGEWIADLGAVPLEDGGALMWRRMGVPVRGGTLRPGTLVWRGCWTFPHERRMILFGRRMILRRRADCEWWCRKWIPVVRVIVRCRRVFMMWRGVAERDDRQWLHDDKGCLGRWNRGLIVRGGAESFGGARNGLFFG